MRQRPVAHIAALLRRALGLASLAVCVGAAAQAPRHWLVIDFMASSGAQREAWVRLLDRFQQANPDLEVRHAEIEQEIYKRDFASLIAHGGVDLAFWFAGAKLEQAAAAGLVKPIDPEWLEGKESFAPATWKAVQWQGKTWALPLKLYPWGFYYRRSVFDKLGLKPPATWSEFLQACERMKAAHITCTASGGRDGWPLAAWFDLLDLRLNGLDYHRRLLNGDAKFSDPQVAAVLDEWRRLLQGGHMARETLDAEWSEVLPYVYRGLVGTALMGSFATAKFPAVLREDMGFFPFPRLRADLPTYEDAPLDVLVLPAHSEHPQAQRRFLRFLLTTDALSQLAGSDGTLSPRHEARGANPLQQAARQTLEGAAGVAFFFDRDARPALTQGAFAAFRRFVRPPHDVGAAVRALQKAATAGDGDTLH